MSIVSVENAEHYQWGERCDGWHLLSSERLSVIEERMPAGASAGRHSHASVEQFVYILLGDARVELDGESFELTRNQGVRVGPGTPHRLSNPGANELVFLLISSPPVGDDRRDEE